MVGRHWDWELGAGDTYPPIRIAIDDAVMNEDWNLSNATATLHAVDVLDDQVTVDLDGTVSNPSARELTFDLDAGTTFDEPGDYYVHVDVVLDGLPADGFRVPSEGFLVYHVT